MKFIMLVPGSMIALKWSQDSHTCHHAGAVRMPQTLMEASSDVSSVSSVNLFGLSLASACSSSDLPGLRTAAMTLVSCSSRTRSTSPRPRPRDAPLIRYVVILEHRNTKVAPKYAHAYRRKQHGVGRQLAPGVLGFF